MADMISLRFGNRHLRISHEEAQRVGPLMKELEALANRPFAHDPNPSELLSQPPGPNVMTPNRLRELIRERLKGLARASEFESRLLAELRINGIPFADVEAGADIMTGTPATSRPRSRLFR